MEITQSESYYLLSYLIIALLVLLILIFILFRLGFLRRITEFSEKHKKAIFILFLSLFIIIILLFGILRFAIYDLNRSTIVRIEEKILLIEIDDYWNIDETAPYFERYGYTMERYRSVSDVIDKYDFTATLGVTPYIFVEELRQNYPLGSDEDMVNYLLELHGKGYELAMHGYNHCRNVNYCPKYEEVWYNVFNGKLELERSLGVGVGTYFPPGNTWTTEQYENVRKAGFFIIGNTQVLEAYFDENVIITPRGYDPIYIYDWYTLDFRHAPYEEWVDEYENKSLFILQLHANTFDSQEKLGDLDRFLARVKQDDTKVMTYSEFYKYIMEERERRALTGNFILEVD
jgi:hypothetical protein